MRPFTSLGGLCGEGAAVEKGRVTSAVSIFSYGEGIECQDFISHISCAF